MYFRSYMKMMIGMRLSYSCKVVFTDEEGKEKITTLIIVIPTLFYCSMILKV